MNRFRLFLLAAVLAALGLCSSAGAAPITLGQLAAPGKALDCSPSSGRDEAQTSVAAGSGYVVPTAGVLTSWSTRTELKGSMGLKVFRPFAGQYLVLAADGPKELQPGLLMTFPVSIPVLPGDLVGIELPPFAGAGCYFKTSLEGDVHSYHVERVPVGSTVKFDGGTSNGGRLNISATLLPPPTIASVSPAAGSVAGGSTTISGANFAGVSAVSFGGVPAKSFTVDSEGQISATAPASTTLGAVPLTVTTAAGSATASFTYEGCKVPKLKGKKLKAVRKAANRSDCKLGKVTKRKGATGKTGKVTKQSLKPGTVLAPGTKIKVTLKP